MKKIQRKSSSKQRIEAALKFVNREVERIRAAHDHFIAEAKKKGIVPIYFEDGWKKPNQERDFIRRALVELPAEGHLVNTIAYVLKGILVDGDIPKSVK